MSDSRANRVSVTDEALPSLEQAQDPRVAEAVWLTMAMRGDFGNPNSSMLDDPNVDPMMKQKITSLESSRENIRRRLGPVHWQNMYLAIFVGLGSGRFGHLMESDGIDARNDPGGLDAVLRVAADIEGAAYTLSTGIGRTKRVRNEAGEIVKVFAGLGRNGELACIWPARSDDQPLVAAPKSAPHELGWLRRIFNA